MLANPPHDSVPQPLPRRLKRGGAHNRRDRPSQHLTEAQCRKVIAGVDAALDAEFYFSRFITISWGKSGIPPEMATRATGKFIKLARDWLRTQGYVMPWVWVLENGPWAGTHCHILIYVPRELDPLFRQKPRYWVRKILGMRDGKGTVLTRRLRFAPLAAIHPYAYEAELWGRLHYMLKCAPAQLEAKLGLTGASKAIWGRADSITGKRAGV